MARSTNAENADSGLVPSENHPGTIGSPAEIRSLSAPRRHAGGRYSSRSASIGSTRSARRAGT